MSVQKFELDPLQQVSFDAKALVSLEGYYQAQCPRHAEMLGLRDEELVGRPLEFVIGAELARGVREAVSGQLFRGEGHVSLKSGRNLVVGLGAVRDGDHLLLALSDRTQATQLESRLVLADRLAAVGTVAAGVAHEINNPLAYILANLSYSLSELNGALGDTVAKGSPLGALLEEIVRALSDAEEGAKRVRQIVRDLKTFSRGDQETTEVLDLRPVLDSAINMAWSEIRHRAKLVRDFQELPQVEASAGRLGQIFLNVLVNAAQAIPEGAPEQNHISVVTRRGEGGRDRQISGLWGGDDVGGARADLRSLLHHQAGRRRNRAGTLHHPAAGRIYGRVHRGGQQPGARHALSHLLRARGPAI
jgi:signal transduction histidine kinase